MINSGLGQSGAHVPGCIDGIVNNLVFRFRDKAVVQSMERMLWSRLLSRSLLDMGYLRGLLVSYYPRVNKDGA